MEFVLKKKKEEVKKKKDFVILNEDELNMIHIIYPYAPCL